MRVGKMLSRLWICCILLTALGTANPTLAQQDADKCSGVQTGMLAINENFQRLIDCIKELQSHVATHQEQKQQLQEDLHALRLEIEKLKSRHLIADVIGKNGIVASEKLNGALTNQELKKEESGYITGVTNLRLPKSRGYEFCTVSTMSGINSTFRTECSLTRIESGQWTISSDANTSCRVTCFKYGE
jgi:hypothetical protein